MTDRVLLVGKRAAVLTRLQAALRDVGIEADLTQEVRNADHAQLRPYAAVAFGRAVSEADRSRMKDVFRAANPDVVYVDGLAPITALLVAQFEEALDRRPETARKLRSVVAARGRIELEVRAQAAVQATAYRLTRLYRTRTTQLLDGELPVGPKTIALPMSLARAREAFAVVRADVDEVRVVPLAP
jgi:hypothetical protein